MEDCVRRDPSARGDRVASHPADQKMSDYRGKAVLAAAAWKDLNAKSSAYQAALLRGDDEAARAIRQEAHDMLDTHLDLSGEVAQSTLDILKG